ncbi:MAG: PspC domain-containing protein [Actinomycetota bacterium]|nr:PspC domain-containing protein [Actinomycetota bacterium]
MTVPQPRLYRRSEGKLVAGVAGGLADHLGLNPLVVRVAFVVLTAVNGVGAVLYAVFWAVVRQQVPAPDQPPLDARQRAEMSGQLAAFAAIAAGLLLFLPRLGLGGNSLLAWPVAVAIVGGALIWRQADESQRVGWERLVGGQGANRRDAVLRIAVGVVLVVGGLISALAATGNLVAARDGMLATGVILAGVALVTGPWWWRTWHDLATERRERIRSQERADLAAHVHDSVLHTLALIQRHVEDPREVTRLARGQERELRGWLYRPTGSPDHRLAAAIETAAAEVEDTYGISVEPVVVGDCPVDERLIALVQASREALVNAARHAGVTEISLYAEVEPERVTVFVRDRGTGFDPTAVADDRHGLAGSIVGRMERHGGSADVRSAPAAGTEVRLSMGRAAG